MTDQEQILIVSKIDSAIEKINASSAVQPEKDDLMIIMNLIKTDIQNLVPSANQ